VPVSSGRKKKKKTGREAVIEWLLGKKVVPIAALAALGAGIAVGMVMGTWLGGEHKAIEKREQANYQPGEQRVTPERMVKIPPFRPPIIQNLPESEPLNIPDTIVVDTVGRPDPAEYAAESVTTAAIAITPVQPPPSFFSRTPPWQKYAVAVPPPGNRKMVAVVIDDMGIDRNRSSRMAALPGPLTLSYLTYAAGLSAQASKAKDNGHELMLHVPMEPLAATKDPGRDVLMVNQSAAEIRRRLIRGLDSFSGYVGINNHMGSKFTAYPDGMRIVMDELKSRGLLFLDSRTSESSVGVELAREAGIPHLGRNVFLDNDSSARAVRGQLAQLEEVAKRNGFAIAIGHPHDGTIEALSQWLPTLAAKGIVLVPITAILRYRPAINGNGGQAAAPRGKG
jgi:polysaccharide deacetylase 2 family uncharacterized protein YibQ